MVFTIESLTIMEQLRIYSHYFMLTTSFATTAICRGRLQLALRKWLALTWINARTVRLANIAHHALGWWRWLRCSALQTLPNTPSRV